MAVCTINRIATVTTAAMIMALGCKPPKVRVPMAGRRVVVRDEFEDAASVAAAWRAQEREGAASVDVVALASGSRGCGLHVATVGESVAKRIVDARELAGQRVRLAVMVKADAGASAHVELQVVSPGRRPDYVEYARSGDARTLWTPLFAVVDVPKDAASVEISFDVAGGSATIDDMTLEVLGETPPGDTRPLTPDELSGVEVVARAIGLVRWFHPSDQAATLDWNSFAVDAIERVLALHDGASLAPTLTTLFKNVAPTASFYVDGTTPPRLEIPQGSGVRLTRWRHLGLGKWLAPGVYTSLREGLDPTTDAHLDLYRTLPDYSLTCTTVRASARVDRVAGVGGEIRFRVWRAGTSLDEPAQQIALDGDTVSLEYHPSADARVLQLGLRVIGGGEIDLRDVAVTCDSHAIVIGADGWVEDGQLRSLFTHDVRACGTSTCFRLATQPASVTVDVAHDVIDVPIGGTVRLRLPLVVWTDGVKTFPEVNGQRSGPSETLRDRAMRLAAVAMTWAAVHHFDPQSPREWDEQLPRFLQAAATAESPAGLHDVLRTMTAALHDAHGVVKHPMAPIDGMLPLMLSWIDGSLVVTGGLPQYLEAGELGTTVTAINGKPAAAAVRGERALVSAATTASLTSLVTYNLAMGPRGDLATLELAGTGEPRTVVLPYLDRDTTDNLVTEHRPEDGAEVAPGVVYFDLSRVDATRWAALHAAAADARAIIFDGRGYPTNDALAILSHFLRYEASSPRMVIGLAGPEGPDQYGVAEEGWRVEPSTEQLGARVFVLEDARPQSWAETVLQIVKESELGTLVGEPSAGTNGNVVRLYVPGGFRIQFTGMRVLFADGTELLGRGVPPDVVVHPTKDGLRAGRDEILEAAVRLATESSSTAP